MPLQIDHIKFKDLKKTDLRIFIPKLDYSQKDVKEVARGYLDQCKMNLEVLHKKNYHTKHILRIHTLMVDRLMQYVFEKYESEVTKQTMHRGPYASLIAQGGYGRGEMNIYSDIDLLFIYPKKKGGYIEVLTEKMLYLFWDLKLDVGYATRTIPECKKLFFNDVTIMTALLDARHLCGSREASDNLMKELNVLLKSSSILKKLIQTKLEERDKRIKTQGSSVFILEPNVKESAGGLRDLQTCLWLSKLLRGSGTYHDLLKRKLLNQEEAQTLKRASNFFWRVRDELHLMVEHKADKLTFERQEEIAFRMGYRESGDKHAILAVEKFMQTYYRFAYQTYNITNTLIQRTTAQKKIIPSLVKRLRAKKLDHSFRILDGQIAAKNKEVFDRDPTNFLYLFQHVQNRGLPIHLETQGLVRQKCLLIDSKFRQDPMYVTMFRKMLNSYYNLGNTLHAMHDVHFMDEWIPEFKKLRCRVQHDAYHIYTIDTHSIFAVNELSKLYAGEYVGKFDPYAEMLKQVSHPELLTLSLLLHDIGKGEGGNHSVKGAQIAKGITERLGFTDEEQKTVEFLILSHLMMPHLSQRRDLEDPNLIVNFARSMGSVENLNMLCLLTWADIRAIGPEAWTDWKDNLLRKLYDKTKEVLISGDFSIETAKNIGEKIKTNLMNKFGTRYNKNEFEHFLFLMPPRYFIVAKPDDVERHFLLVKNASQHNIKIEHAFDKLENIDEFLVYSINTPQLFSVITGVMLAFSINVLIAEIFQSKDGHVLVSLKVTDAKGGILVEKNAKEIVSKLEMVFLGRIKVDELLQKRAVPDYLKKKPVQKAKTQVDIDNDVSAYYTVIDIYAHDRLGLLYDITRTLNQQGCYVEVSKISTKVEQVTDVFYVKDIFGHKITNKSKIDLIKKALVGVIDKSVGD